MNNFFASVELLSHPELKGRPVAVSGDLDSRHGIILAKNGPAKALGIRTAETVWQARQKCPDLVLLPPHHRLYKLYFREINRLYQEFTDQVEPFSIDESFLDVTGSRLLFGDGREIADRIRGEVKKRFGLTLSAGVSYNKIFAKMGSDYKKPDATTVISRDNYREILWPLPIRELFTVGESTAQRLEKMGIATIGGLAQTEPLLLKAQLGKQGLQLHAYANGLDDSPVCRFDEKQQAKSVGNGITFSRNLQDEKDVRTALTALSHKVAGRLRQQRLCCLGVKLDIKDAWFRSISRQKQLPRPSQLAEEIAAAALSLCREHWEEGRPIRFLSVTAIYLEKEGAEEQMSLFAPSQDQRDKQEKMERTLDQIRERFGRSSVSMGSLLGNDLGIRIRSEEEEGPGFHPEKGFVFTPEKR